MEYIQLTQENLQKEHICCSMTEKKGDHSVTDKKAWLKERMEEGLVFYKADVRGKVFIEYIPAQAAWFPICLLYTSVFDESFLTGGFEEWISDGSG